MIKLDVKTLSKSIRKITSLNSLVTGLRLEVGNGSMDIYYADGHNTLVDKIEVESDTTGSFIVNTAELSRVLAVCQPSIGIEVDSLNIVADMEHKILKFSTVKYLKAEDDSRVNGSTVYQSIPYRGIGDNVKDTMLVKEDYSALWNRESYDIWDKSELIDYLKEMVSANGKTLLYSTKRNIFFTHSLRYAMIQKTTSEEVKFGIMLSVTAAKALVEILSQMRCDLVQVSNTLSEEKAMSRRLIITDTEGREGYSCEIAVLTKQDLASLDFFCGLKSNGNTLVVNKAFLQDTVNSILITKNEQCSAEVMEENGKYILKFNTELDKGMNDYKLYLSSVSESMHGKKFGINIKSVQMMLSYLRGGSVEIDLINENTEQLIAYLKFTGTDETSAAFYCVTSVS